MKVFVAGATGVVGRRAVQHLVAAGHEVTAVARSDEKAARLVAQGATPVRVDLFDPTAVKEAVAGHDAVVNLATHIPPVSEGLRRAAWAENERLRSEASRNLADAALAAGATRFVQESIAFAYADGGSEWIDEDTPLDPAPYAASIRAAEAQAARVTEAGGTGVVLRFGMFYAPDSGHTRTQVRLARAGLAAWPGAADGYLPIVHADDAGAAVAAALAVPAGTYHVVDDEPLTRSELSRIAAAAVGRRRLIGAPRWATTRGGSVLEMVGRSQRVSNRRLREASGWRPSRPSAREGLPEVATAVTGGDRRRLLVRVAFAFLALTGLQVGLWALLAPQSFYDSFPGGGRAWVGVDGPFNEHLIRDVGAGYLALGVLAIAAALRLQRTLSRTAAITWLVFGVPHLTYHVAHRDLYDTSDQIGNLGALAVGVVLPALVLWWERGAADRPPGA